MGKKSSPTAPAAPDPVATAQAQSKANIDAATAQANLNRIDQYTPQGSLKYTQEGTNADGTPRYSQTQTYSADEQAKYDQANKVALALGGLANNNIGRVQEAQSKPFTYDGMTARASAPSTGGIQKDLDYSGLTKLPGTDDFGAEARRMSDTVYSQAASRLDPQWQQNDNDVKAQLAAQGISENSDAYRRAYDNLNRSKTDAYNQATFSAQQAGANEQSRLFGLAMGARQQGQNEVNTQGAFHNTAQGQQFNQDMSAAGFQNGNRQGEIEEASYLRNMPINDIAALLGTGPGVQGPEFNPVSQVGVAAPDYAGMVQNQYNGQMNTYNQQQAARSNMMGSIFGAAGSLGGAAIMMSDRRVKEDIKRIGTLANGLATYAFKYIGFKAQQFGVMAQEVLNIRPDAIVYGDDGLMRVNYKKVY